MDYILEILESTLKMSAFYRYHGHINDNLYPVFLFNIHFNVAIFLPSII